MELIHAIFINSGGGMESVTLINSNDAPEETMMRFMEAFPGYCDFVVEESHDFIEVPLAPSWHGG
jgi:hypothetical protein